MISGVQRSLILAADISQYPNNFLNYSISVATSVNTSHLCDLSMFHYGRGSPFRVNLLSRCTSTLDTAFTESFSSLSYITTHFISFFSFYLFIRKITHTQALYFLAHLPNALQEPGLGQAEPRRLKLHLTFSDRWQKLKHLGDLLSSQAH